MIELVLTVCSIVHGAQCKVEKQTYIAEQVTLFECMRYGQLEVMRWQASHPNWKVQRWRCGAAHKLQAKA